MSDKKERISFIGTLTLFGLIYCSISLVNHYNFRTYAYDLGLINNSIYDYAHFRWNDCMLMQPQYKNLLSDHFTLLPILLSPLSYLFGSYTILLVQIAGILLGGYGIYKLFIDTNSHWFALIAMVHFLTCWGIFSALSFDYHDNVLGAMAVPWLFYYFKKEKWLPASLVVLIILISKENMALWMIFISVGLLVSHIRDRKKILVAFTYFFFSIIYFYVVVNIIMPSLANTSKGYSHFNYAVLGNGFKDAFTFIFHHPVKTVQLLFENHLHNPDLDGIKAELHWMVLVSGGYCFLFRPQYLIMLIPIYAQKLLNDDFVKWGINAHYSIEFVPILSIMLFSVLSTIRNQRIKIQLAAAACAISFFFTMHKIDHRISKWYDGLNTRFYSLKHYRNNFNVSQAHEVLDILIPKNAIVSAHHQVVPHIAFRDYIYRFPDVLNAEYIVLLEHQSPYPMNEESFSKLENEYLNNPLWSTIYHENNMLILKRK